MATGWSGLGYFPSCQIDKAKGKWWWDSVSKEPGQGGITHCCGWSLVGSLVGWHVLHQIFGSSCLWHLTKSSKPSYLGQAERPTCSVCWKWIPETTSQQLPQSLGRWSLLLAPRPGAQGSCGNSHHSNSDQPTPPQKENHPFLQGWREDLFQTRDRTWADCPKFPNHIMHTWLRPDVIIFSDSTKLGKTHGGGPQEEACQIPGAGGALQKLRLGGSLQADESGLRGGLLVNLSSSGRTLTKRNYEEGGHKFHHWSCRESHLVALDTLMTPWTSLMMHPSPS